MVVLFHEEAIKITSLGVRQVGLSQPDALARDYSAGPSLTYRVAIGSFHVAFPLINPKSLRL